MTPKTPQDVNPQPITRESVVVGTRNGRWSMYTSDQLLGLLDERDALKAEVARLERELACYRAARVTWPPHVLEAVARGDVAACAEDARKRHANWQALEQERDEVRRQLFENLEELETARAFGDRECAARMELQAELARVTAQRDEARAEFVAERERRLAGEGKTT